MKRIFNRIRSAFSNDINYTAVIAIAGQTVSVQIAARSYSQALAAAENIAYDCGTVLELTAA